MDLDDRNRRVLQAVIDSYIASGMPIGSNVLVKRYDFGVSSATLRNIMAELEEMGFLTHPHTSAGRVPTDLGYRYYIDALISIEMVDHLVSPAQQKEGLAVPIYRGYFDKVAQWVKPGACFGFQAILRHRVPRTRKDLEDLKFTADVIFPGGLNPRLEELVAAATNSWEIVQLHTRRVDYGKTTAEWHRRFLMNEKKIREKWGEKIFVDYDNSQYGLVEDTSNQHIHFFSQEDLIRIYSIITEKRRQDGSAR